MLLYTVRVQALSEQYIKLLELGRTTYITRFTQLMFRLLHGLILLTLYCTIVFCSCCYLYFLIALFSYSAFMAVPIKSVVRFALLNLLVSAFHNNSKTAHYYTVHDTIYYLAIPKWQWRLVAEMATMGLDKIKNTAACHSKISAV